MSCSRTQHDDTCGDQTHDLLIRSLMLYHYAYALPPVCFDLVDVQIFSDIDHHLALPYLWSHPNFCGAIPSTPVTDWDNLPCEIVRDAP